LILNCSQNLANDSALKEAVLSVTILFGQSNLVMRSSRNPMITLWEALLVGIASIHLVKKSVAVRIHLCFPLEVGWISPIKSRPHCWKGLETTIGFKGRDLSYCFPENIWHLMQALTFLHTLVNKVGQ
jgi:hypothetical protein